MNIFDDQRKFMEACGQTTGEWNAQQFELYLKLIREEATELFDAVAQDDKVEVFDALQDIIVVCVGAGLSAGFPMEAGWKEVIRSNMSKVDPATGKVLRRSDGKIIKGESYHPPRLAPLLGLQKEHDD